MNYNSSVKHLYVLNKRLEEIVEGKFENKYQLKTLKQEFIAFSFGKAYKTHKAILLLCEMGFGEDAAILARSLFDLGITTLYILSDKTGYLINRYYDYDWVIRKEIFDYAKTSGFIYRKLKRPKANTQQAESNIKEIYKEAEKALKKHKYDPRKGWSNKNIKQMASCVGRGNEYKTIYRLLSQLAHSAPRTINDYVSFEDGGFMINSGSGHNWVGSVLVTSFDHLHTISVAWNKSFELGLSEKLEHLKGQWLSKIDIINEENDTKSG